MSPRILVVGSCTGSKRGDGCPRPLSIDDFRDPRRLREREAELAPWRLPAEKMYTGRQHLHTVAAIEALRREFGPEAVCLAIISAGYGLLHEDTPIVPYEVTFTLSRTEGRALARHLGIAAAVREACAGFSLVVFLLGSRYLEAVEPPLRAADGQRLVFLARPGEASRLEGSGVAVVAVGRGEAAEYGEGLVAPKGKMLRLFAHGLVRAGETLFDDVLQDNSASFIGAMKAGREELR